MKTLKTETHTPSRHHIVLAAKFGNDFLDAPAPEEFFNGSPQVTKYERAESGILIKIKGCVKPHTDNWMVAHGRIPKTQRSLFWVLKGTPIFKVDGFEAIGMRPGDFVIFDHRIEHMVLADGSWMGAAWQMALTSRKQQKMVKDPAGW